ncbi:MAG: site-specific integrase [Thermoleophilia bacterium]|nr:site-specific integrase [Thermoleophilia bacterium]
MSAKLPRVNLERGLYRRGLHYIIGWRDASDGKWRTRSLPASTTLQAARKERDAMLGQAAQGESLMSVVSKKTVHHFAVAYLSRIEAQVKAGDRSTSTLALRKAQYRDHLEERFGSKRVRAVGHNDVLILISELRTEGLSGATVNKIAGLLSAILRDAVRSGDLGVNPVTLVDASERPSNAHTRNRRTLTDAELELLIDHAGSEQTKLLVAFLAGSGLRLSEALGLRPEDVDLSGAVSVSGQLIREGQERKTTKTPTAVRIVNLLSDAHAAVRAQARMAKGVRAGSFFWTTPKGRELGQANTQGAIRRAGEDAGLGAVSPHELRYTYASRLDEHGVSLADAAAEMGHSPTSHASMTTKYLRSRGSVDDRHARIRAAL